MNRRYSPAHSTALPDAGLIKIALIFFNLAVFAALVLSPGCGREPVLVIDPTETEAVSGGKHLMSDTNALTVALGAVLTPQEDFIYYRRLIDFIARKAGKSIRCVEKRSYAEINELIGAGVVDMAFVCSLPYVEGRDSYGLKLLAAPMVGGRTEYYSYVIVPAAGNSTNMADLVGKTFAFTDPMSNSGTLAPTFLLHQAGESPRSFFNRIVYTYAHDRTIELVSQALVDGGAVHSLIWERYLQKNPEHATKIRIIARIGPFGIPPVVVRRGLDEQLQRQLLDILLHAHEDPAGAQILAGMMIDRFVSIDDTAYDSIRKMKEMVTDTGVIRDD